LQTNHVRIQICQIPLSLSLISPIAWIIAVLYALAMAALLMYGLNLLWLAVQYARGRRTRPRLSPDAPAPDDTWPDVTVQLPLYNEPYVTARLIDACARLTYPRGKLEIQVLDDSTDETGRIAAERVVYWHTRGIDIAHIRRWCRPGGAISTAIHRSLRACKRSGLMRISPSNSRPGTSPACS
jgi:cellulose synthase/poly-beta-1,6-N-acetylglucosamine synthase-like glycosyltransferase